uniref:Uncharacterized protein n=1 Tax=Romanomermis culicivorax TaxID=13658 RepID=A0A915HQH2_ROMCU
MDSPGLVSSVDELAVCIFKMAIKILFFFILYFDSFRFEHIDIKGKNNDDAMLSAEAPFRWGWRKTTINDRLIEAARIFYGRNERPNAWNALVKETNR